MKKNLLLLCALVGFCALAFANATAVAQRNQPTRSVVSTALGSTVFGQAVFASNNNFFLSASTFDPAYQTNNLSRVQLKRVNGAWTVVPNPIAPATATVNNSEEPQPNPINTGNLDKLALFDGKQPVVTLAIPEGENATLNKICLVTDPVQGATVLTNATDILKDADNTEISSHEGTLIAAIIASNDTIFAAVPPDDGPWGDDYSGVVRLRINNNQLSVRKLDGSGFGADNAYKIDLTAFTATGQYLPLPKKVRFFAVNEKDSAQKMPDLSAQVDLWWDSVLQRLFIGLTGVAGKIGVVSAIEGLLVGGITDDQLRLQPVVDLQGALVNSILGNASDDPQNTIIGFNVDATHTATTSIFKVRTMHTSTGRAYAIVNGGTSNDDNFDQSTLRDFVAALPLVTSGVNAGMIAQKNGDDAKVATADQMTTWDGDAAKVGVDPSYLCHNVDLTATFSDMRVVGDTVYVSVSGTRNAAHRQEQGIFASRAIFDSGDANKKPLVRAWTPWQRVMGYTEKVDGFGVDPMTGCYWYLEGTNNAVAKVTRWDQGDTRVGGIHSDGTNAGSPLSSVIDPVFGTSADGTVFNGGVFGLFSFDDETLGFKPYTLSNEFPNFSMMAITGYNLLALVQTGVQNADGVYQQTGPFVLNQNVFVFDSTKLPDLGAITAVEVARVAPSGDGEDPNDLDWTKGWLFIGGERGIAVLRYKTGDPYWDGTGWANKEDQGLDSLKGSVVDDYPGGANYGFQQILYKSNGTTSLNITEVRKLVSDGTYLYILTRNKLHRLTMTQKTMVNGVLESDDYFQTPLDLTSGPIEVEKKISSERAFVLVQNQDEFFDMMLVLKGDDRIFLLATTKGLLTVALPEEGGYERLSSVLVRSTATGADPDPAYPSLGPVFHLDFVSQFRGGQLDDNDLAQGNLYALAVDRQIQNLNVYRFDVNGSSISYFNEPYKDGSNTPTDYFYQIGSIANIGPHEYSGLLDFFSRTRHFGDLKTYFVDKMPQWPLPDKFLSTNAISLNANLRYGLHPGTKTVDSASGAVYVAGEPGLWVNE